MRSFNPSWLTKLLVVKREVGWLSTTVGDGVGIASDDLFFFLDKMAHFFLNLFFFTGTQLAIHPNARCASDHKRTVMPVSFFPCRLSRGVWVCSRK